MRPAPPPLTRQFRRQLSMFVPREFAEELESIRRIVDPVQSEIIPAHVTLCREDEISGLAIPDLQALLSDPGVKPVTLSFGQPEVFGGHGLMLNCIEGQDRFQALREHILGSTFVRASMPHITLAHPRNPKVPVNSLALESRFSATTTITFDSICLIEQEGANPWSVLCKFQLRA